MNLASRNKVHMSSTKISESILLTKLKQDFILLIKFYLESMGSFFLSSIVVDFECEF